MTWELCEKLKKAGFPQMGSGYVIMKESPLPNETYTRMSWEMYTQRVYTSEFVYEPTLEELMQACELPIDKEALVDMWIQKNDLRV